MTRTISIFVLALGTFALLAPAAWSQDAERVWENGTVWTVGYAETKPGQFNAYIKDLSNVYKRYLDAQKEDGLVVSYKILNVPFARDGEPNLMFLIEYKDWEAFDRGNVEYFEKLAAKLQGSVSSAQQANIDREALRDLRGGLVTQEIMFKK